MKRVMSTLLAVVMAVGIACFVGCDDLEDLGSLEQGCVHEYEYTFSILGNVYWTLLILNKKEPKGSFILKSYSFRWCFRPL